MYPAIPITPPSGSGPVCRKNVDTAVIEPREKPPINILLELYPLETGNLSFSFSTRSNKESAISITSV